MSNNILKSIILSVVLILFLPFYSCQKTKETVGIVIVKDINGQLISGATVTLHQDGQISPQGNFFELRITNHPFLLMCREAVPP